MLKVKTHQLRNLPGLPKTRHLLPHLKELSQLFPKVGENKPSGRRRVKNALVHGRFHLQAGGIEIDGSGAVNLGKLIVIVDFRP